MEPLPTTIVDLNDINSTDIKRRIELHMKILTYYIGKLVGQNILAKWPRLDWTATEELIKVITETIRHELEEVGTNVDKYLPNV